MARLVDRVSVTDLKTERELCVSKSLESWELQSYGAAEAAPEITHLKELCRILKPWLLAIDRKFGRVQRRSASWGRGFGMRSER